MMIHSMAPPTGIRKVRAIDGRLMFTIEVSSMIMNVPIATKAKVNHALAGSSITAPELDRAGTGRVKAGSAYVSGAFIHLLWLCLPGVRDPLAGLHAFPRGSRRWTKNPGC